MKIPKLKSAFNRYDSEWCYSNRCVDLLKKIAKLTELLTALAVWRSIICQFSWSTKFLAPAVGRLPVRKLWQCVPTWTRAIRFAAPLQCFGKIYNPNPPTAPILLGLNRVASAIFASVRAIVLWCPAPPAKSWRKT